MMDDIFHIYKDKRLKYPLDDHEYSLIDRVWEFIKVFKRPFIYISDYRNYLIEKFHKKYTPDEFYILESIAEKLFWNLRWEVYGYFMESNQDKIDVIPNDLLLCDVIEYDNEDDLDRKIKGIYMGNNVIYRSFINKIVMIDRDNKVIYHKKMEGSSNIFSQSSFNMCTLMTLFDRKNYEKTMKDPKRIKNDQNKCHHYYQLDYGFPNLNYCAYRLWDKGYRIDRIKKMYYNNDDRNWIKIL